MYLTFDDAKDAANLRKHGLSLADAALVYDAADKLTILAPPGVESRRIDVAFVPSLDLFLALVYVERGEEMRAISLRRASRKERRHYADAQEV